MRTVRTFCKSNKIISSLMLILSPFFTSVAAPGHHPQLRDLVPHTIRGALPNVVAKLKKGQVVNIAYFGGSITAQEGWRVLCTEWFQKRFPRAKIRETQASIGGTGSDLGVFRLERDVLAHRPDLIFVEFASNDYTAPSNLIRNAMEGIVRKTWKAYPDCDICFIYTITHRELNILREGKMKRTTTIMEELADYYQIPSVNLGYDVVHMEKSGKLIMKPSNGEMTKVSGNSLNKRTSKPTDTQGRTIFAPDGIHPYLNTGHSMYMNALAKAMNDMIDIKQGAIHNPGQPLYPSNWEKATLLPLSQSKMTGPWSKLDLKQDPISKIFSRRIPCLYKGEPGAKLTFSFKGSDAAIYDLVGPSCGNIKVTLDGKEKIVPRIDRFSSYYRLRTLDIGHNLSDKVIHQVVIEALPDILDKRKILLKNNIEDLNKNPEKYKGANWYAAALLIVGDIIEAPILPPKRKTEIE